MKLIARRTSPRRRCLPRHPDNAGASWTSLELPPPARGRSITERVLLRSFRLRRRLASCLESCGLLRSALASRQLDCRSRKSGRPQGSPSAQLKAASGPPGKAILRRPLTNARGTPAEATVSVVISTILRVISPRTAMAATKFVQPIRLEWKLEGLCVFQGLGRGTPVVYEPSPGLRQTPPGVPQDQLAPCGH